MYNASANSGIQVTENVQIKNETALQLALANAGPVTVAIQVTASFQSYASGVYTDKNCTGAVNHAVIIG